jgi:benzoate-CoA ligase
MSPTSPPLPLPVPPPDRFNAAAWLLAANRQRAAKLAYLDDTRRLSFGELDDQVRRCAAGLLALGIRREERVMIVMHDSVDFPVAFLGALYAGIVPVPVNTLLTAADYAFMLRHCNAQALLVSLALWPVAQPALAASGLAPAVFVAGTTTPDGTRSFTSLLDAAPLASPDE